ncbi:FeoB-associated Cys-rich membrane protein [Capnocytophaga cynodegmi]|nr:FeoB-associated Cys-rich membrane protein [Capnocytophaga cynodegmi]
MGIQKIIAYILVLIAVSFLIKKFFLKNNKKKTCGKDDNQCKCG